jgi:hypothetical protein
MVVGKSLNGTVLLCTLLIYTFVQSSTAALNHSRPMRWKNLTRDRRMAIYDDEPLFGESHMRRQLIPDMRATKTIYGILVDLYIYLPEDENRDTYAECFKGMELQSCQHCGATMTRSPTGDFKCIEDDTLLRDDDDRGRVQNPFGDSVYNMAGGGDDEGWETPPDSMDIDYRRSNTPFCLYCCSMNDPQPGYETKLTWDLYCPIDGLDKPKGLNPYTDFDNYQFRFARRDSLSDVEVVTCDLLRSPEQKDLVLQGYDLTIYIVDHYDGTDYWRGVESCEVDFIFDPVWSENSCRETFNEKTFVAECKCVGDPCVFREKITMIRQTSKSGTNAALVIVIWCMVFCFGCCGLLGYYTGRCGQWCDYTDGVKWCDGLY